LTSAPGSLYTALPRLEEKGWLTSRWDESEKNRRAKYYQLTAAGKRQLAAETENWERISLAITRALRAQTGRTGVPACYIVSLRRNAALRCE
jgi:DNA-binding PadR family transcriptional regulator